MSYINEANTESFISAVENHPVIWNSSHNDYSDKLIKKNAWETVIKQFVDDFDEKTAAEKNGIGHVFQRKWKSLRDSFTRELARKKQDIKTGMTVSSRKVYVYFEPLKFLESAVKPTLSDEAKQSTAEDTGGAKDLEETEVAPAPKRHKRNNSKKVAVPDEKDSKSHFLSNDVDLNDEDRLFMMSMVPELKRLPDHLKLEVKSSILQLISTARMRSLQSQNERSHRGQDLNYGHIRPNAPKHQSLWSAPVNLPVPHQHLPSWMPPVQVNVPITLNCDHSTLPASQVPIVDETLNDQQNTPTPQESLHESSDDVSDCEFN